MNEDVKKRLIQARRDIQKKYSLLRNGEMMADELKQEFFKPLTDPLQKIISAPRPPDISNVNVKPITISSVNVKVPVGRKKPSIRKRRVYYDANDEMISPSDEDDDQLETTPFNDTNDSFNNTMIAQSTPSSSNLSPLDITNPYLKAANEKNDESDKTYGIHVNSDTNKFVIGDSEVFVDDSKRILNIKGINYPQSPGLWSLLTSKRPIDHTEDELKHYIAIVTSTNAHKAGKVDDGKLLGNAGHKWTKIIKPNLDGKKRTTSGSSGQGLDKIVTNRPIDYVYFDRADELIERLDLLHRSKMAGNTNCDNEIISIEEELRELNIIY